MYTGDFNNPIAEFKQDGTLVKSFTPAAPTRSTYGMAYDPLRKTLIVCGQAGSAKGNAAPNGVRMVAWECDPNGTSFVETGTMFFSADLKIPSSSTTVPPGGTSGGCHMTIEKRRLPTSLPNVFNTIDVPVLTWMSQAASDTILQMYGRYQHYPYLGNGSTLAQNSGGDIGMKGDAPYINNTAWNITLNKSTATNATLYLSLKSSNIAFPYPPFVAGSVVCLDPTSPLFLPLGTLQVQGGTATPGRRAQRHQPCGDLRLLPVGRGQRQRPGHALHHGRRGLPAVGFLTSACGRSWRWPRCVPPEHRPLPRTPAIALPPPRPLRSRAVVSS